MKDGAGWPRRDVVVAACLAPLVAGMAWGLYGDVGLNLADGGFLWYGASRTLAGEVPLRDFQSYEPGRYYWIALWSPIVGDGLLGMRRAIALFEIVGLAAGLQVARRVVPHVAWLVPVAIALVLWMFPGYKGFEPALAMVAVYAGVRLVESPDRRTAFGVGVVLGIAAFFGRNHALYGALGILLLLAWLAWREPERRHGRLLCAIGLGGCVGSIPLLVMMVFVPGFAASLWASVVFFVEHGANLPAPVPWPWRVEYEGLSMQVAVAHFMLGAAFLLVPFVYVSGVALASRRDAPASSARSVLAATTAIGVFYLHHAAIRSDASHLAQSIHPALLACLAIPGALAPRWRAAAGWSVAVGLAALTLGVPPVANLSLALPGQARTAELDRVEFAGDVVRVPPGVARYVSRIERAAARHVGEDDTLFVAPFTPGIYCLLGKRSPVWGLYFLWKADPEEEADMIRRFEAERLDWALVSTGAIDGREDLRFWNSHPRVWAWLWRELDVVREPLLPQGMLLLGRPDAGGAPPHGAIGDAAPERR
jgi:hypothetical protein